MKKKMIISFVILTIVSFNLLAQTRSRLSKVGFVDSAAIFNNILQDETLIQIIIGKFEKNEQILVSTIEEIKLIKAEITELEREINQSQTDVSALENQSSKLENKLKTLEERYKGLSPIVSMQKSKRSRAINIEVQKHIAVSVITITRREGYTAIFEKKDNGILYVDKDFDITSQILAFVRESIKKQEG